MALNQVANVAAPEPQLLSIQPYDVSLIGEIERALLESDLGLTPANDGTIIRLPIPPLTEERRKELVKQAKNRGEEAKIGVRGLRRGSNDMLRDLEKGKEISEDDLKRALEKVQKQTDVGITQVDAILKIKEEEILAV